MNLLKDYKDDLVQEFKGYNGKKFGKDLMAGITVAAVALPLALAFGVSSGATAAAGMVSAIIGGVVIGSFSGASFQISGPTGAMTAILVTLAAKFGMNGILLSCFLAGFILVIAGIFKLGQIIYFIPSSVITGFTSGIAIIIALGQLDNFFGVKSEGSMVISKLFSYFTGSFNLDWQSTSIGILVILIMIVWPKKLNKLIPSSLLALVVVLVFNTFAKWKVEMVGEIPRTLFLNDRLDLFNVSWSQFSELLMPALSIAALAMIESLLCGASAGKMRNERLNGDRELVAQGLGNIVIPIFGGVPATAAIARTSVIIKAGMQTRLAGIIHAGFLLLSMFVLTPVMSKIPLSALAGILIVTAFRMNDWENIRYIFSHKFKSGIAKFLITMAATVVLDLTQAIIIGVAFSTALIVVKITDIEISIAEIESDRLEEIGIDLPHVSNKISIAYLTGTIFFAVIEKLKMQLSSFDKDILIISMRGVPVIDLSGIQGLIELIEDLKKDGVTVMLTSLQPKVLRELERGGIFESVDREHVFDSAENAIVQAHIEL